MENRPGRRKYRVAVKLCGWLPVIWACCAGPAWGCLRDQMDERAVQWSSVIVVAKLFSVGDSKEMAATTDGKILYRIFTFDVLETLGAVEKPEHSKPPRMEVVHFEGAAGKDKPCGILMKENIGKEMLLLLRQEAMTAMSVSDADVNGKKVERDPRPADFNARGYFVLVSGALRGDLNDEQMAQWRKTISDARSAPYDPAEAQRQADVLAHAQDDTEADDAEKSLTAMGYPALPVIRAAMIQADVGGKARLKELIEELDVAKINVTAGD